MIAPTQIFPPKTQHFSRDITLRHSTSTGPQRTFWANAARYRLLVGGVGSGKTRAGCVEILKQPAGSTGMVLAPTYPMLRDATLRTFMELVHRGGILKAWHKAEMTVELIDGKTVMFRSADNPDRLRGPNIGWFYLDEAAMMMPDTWLIMIGRLREMPGRAWATSTPRGKNWLHKIFTSGPDYSMVHSSSRQNPYLPPEFIRSLEATYSTRMMRQEVEGEFIDDVEGAIWTYDLIDAHRVTTHPTLTKIVIAIDPAVTSGADSDETGIVVVGKGDDKHYYVLGDYTMRDTPTRWITKAVDLYHSLEANEIIAEVNNGGDLIRDLLKKIDSTIPYRGVHASRGKVTRAEPVSLLYEQGLVHHVGTHRHLEDEMTQWVPGDKSPNRIDALVWGIQALKREGVYL